MKIISNIIKISLTLLLIIIPISAQQIQMDPCTKATMDAKNDINKPLWIGAGCLLSFTGILLAYVIEPTPQATKLIGKDANYVAIYTDCYKSEMKKMQTNNALIGCVGCGVGWIVYYVIVLAAYNASYDSTY